MYNLPIAQQITFLPAIDLEETARFYEQVLGFSLELDQGACRIYRVAGGAYLGFCQRDLLPEHRERIILTLVTPEVDAWAARLQKAGVSLDHPPRLNERYQIYHFYFNDPNNYKIEIQRFLHPFGEKA